jgi:hypothetical protein
LFFFLPWPNSHCYRIWLHKSMSLKALFLTRRMTPSAMTNPSFQGLRK